MHTWVHDIRPRITEEESTKVDGLYGQRQWPIKKTTKVAEENASKGSMQIANGRLNLSTYRIPGVIYLRIGHS